MTTLKLRRMTRSDIDSVLALGKRYGGPQSHLCYSDLTAMNPGASTDMSFVAEDEGKLIGFIKAQLEYMYVPVTEVCMIRTVIVDPDYRGQGIGSMLVNELIDSCVLNEINTIRALVDDHDNDLKAFAEYLGFRRSKIINYDKTIED